MVENEKVSILGLEIVLKSMVYSVKVQSSRKYNDVYKLDSQYKQSACSSISLDLIQP